MTTTNLHTTRAFLWTFQIQGKENAPVNHSQTDPGDIATED